MVKSKKNSTFVLPILKIKLSNKYKLIEYEET